MNGKQSKTIARNARLNYLVDHGMEADEIYETMKTNHAITLNFITNIKAKREREKLIKYLETN